MSKLERLRKEYQHALRSTYVSRDADECGRTYDLVDEAAADALITALEAEVQRAKFQSYNELRQRAEKAEAERHQALFAADGWHRQFKHAAEVRRAEKARAEKAEAEVALRDRMLVAEYDSPTPKTAGYMRWFADLRARAEKEAADA